VKGFGVFERDDARWEQRPTLFSLAPNKFAFIVALVAAIAALPDLSFAVDGATDAKIARVELDLKLLFKVGSWTPVRVEIDGASTGEKRDVAVTVEDSDGVPTTASRATESCGQ